MTTDNLPAPWSNRAVDEPEPFNLEAAIDGALAIEQRRRRSGSIIDAAHQECRQILAEKFEELIRLSLPGNWLEALKYEIKADKDIFSCTCRLRYLGQDIYLSRPHNSLSDWRVQSSPWGAEMSSSDRLPLTLMLYLDRIRKSWGEMPFDDLPEVGGKDDDAVTDIYFAG